MNTNKASFSEAGSALLVFLGLLLVIVIVTVFLPLALFAILTSSLTGSAGSLAAILTSATTLAIDAFFLGAIGCFFMAIAMLGNYGHLGTGSFAYLVAGWIGGIIGLILANFIAIPAVITVTLTAIAIALLVGAWAFFSYEEQPTTEYSNRDWPHPDF